MDESDSSSSSSSDYSSSDSDSLIDRRSRLWNREGNKCLFCHKIMENVVDALNHCKTDHNFDVFEMVEKFSMTRTEYTRFINYIRTKKPNASALNQCNRPVWKKANCTRVYLKNDLWLINDIVGLKSKCDDPMPKYVNSESGKVVMFVHHFLELQKRLQELSDKVKEMGREINDAQERYFDSGPPSQCVDGQNKTVSCSWQREYLCARDHVRSFGSALACSVILSGKTVLAAGWGSISLALLALDAEAQSVGVLARDIDEVQLFRRVTSENNLSERLNLVEDDESSTRQFDFVLCDWMGHFLFFENKLDSALFARDKLLAPNGRIVPSKFSISMFGINDGNLPTELRIANYNLGCMIKPELIKPVRQAVNVSDIITDSAVIYSMDLRTFTKSDLCFETDFVLHGQRCSDVTALVGYFEAFVDERRTHPPLVSTSPHAHPSRWEQTVFHLSEKEPCEKGSILHCRLKCLVHPRKPSNFIILLSINSKNHSYEFPLP